MFVLTCVFGRETTRERESHSNVTEGWFSKAPALHSRLWASLNFHLCSAWPRSIYENVLPRFMENTSRGGVDGVIWRREELTATAYSYRLCIPSGQLVCYHKAMLGLPCADEGPKTIQTTFQFTWCLYLPLVLNETEFLNHDGFCTRDGRGSGGLQSGPFSKLSIFASIPTVRFFLYKCTQLACNKRPDKVDSVCPNDRHQWGISEQQETNSNVKA